jgi:hypothetical protein
MILVEVLGDFFNGRIPGLDEVEIDNDDFKSEEDTVEDVVPPLEGLESRCIGVLVEELETELVVLMHTEGFHIPELESPRSSTTRNPWRAVHKARSPWCRCS